MSSEDSFPKGHVVLAHPQLHDKKNKGKDQRNATSEAGPFYVQCQSLEYSGEFYLVKRDLGIAIETELPDDEVDIATLPIMPLGYATPSIREKLTKRAETWWKLRGKKLVSYEGVPSSETRSVCGNPVRRSFKDG